jgi:hypothetical protein
MIGFGSNNGASTGGNVGDADKLAKFGNTLASGSSLGKLQLGANSLPMLRLLSPAGNTSIGANSIVRANLTTTGQQTNDNQNNYTVVTGASSQVTVNFSGWYEVGFSGFLRNTSSASASATEAFSINVCKNSISSGNLVVFRRSHASVASSVFSSEVGGNTTGVAYLNAGDVLIPYFERQNSGTPGSAEINNSGGDTTVFTIKRIT